MATIEIYGDIGESWWFEDESITGKTISARLAEIPEGEAIALRINSSGGDVNEGIAIYNLLKGRSQSITTYIDGYCLSAASIIALAGGRIVSPESSIWMIHNPATISWGDANEHRKTASVLDTHRDAILGIYRDRTGKSDAEIITALDEETWFTGSEAVAFGLADELGDAPVEMPVSIENALRPWFKVSAQGKKKLKAVGLMPRSNKVAAKATTQQPKEKTKVPKENETEEMQIDAQGSTIEMKALLARVTDLEVQAKAKDEAIAAKERELSALKRKDAITALYNKVRNSADGLVKSNAPKLSTAEFEALGFTGDSESDIKALLDNDQAETLLSQADFYVKMAHNRPVILQTSLRTGDEPLPEKEGVEPEADPEFQSDMQRFEAKLKTQKAKTKR